ncbi:Ribosome quality control complex subunit NEMF-like protein [Drosera capensis]
MSNVPKNTTILSVFPFLLLVLRSRRRPPSSSTRSPATMVKVRMNTADVAAEVKCLRRLIGMRCSNVYDISPKSYIFKLVNSSGVTESGESEKVLLLMESGVRLHTTQYVRDKSNTPSGFTLKLRKHIRTRRLEDVRQLGYDRIVVFQFGLGANAHYIILELYAQGNIILTDSDFMVLTLLRSHRDDDKGFAIMSRHRYPIETCRAFERTTLEKLKLALTMPKGLEELSTADVNDSAAGEGGTDMNKAKHGGKKMGKSSNKNDTSNDSARAKQVTLKALLGEALGYGPQLSEHMILEASLAPNSKISKDEKWDDDKVQNLAESVAKFEDWLEDVISGSKIPEGYILMQAKKSGEKLNASMTPDDSSKIYDEYCPILLNQFKTRDLVQFGTFDAALDEFYSKIESQRAEQQQKSREGSAMQKLNKIRLDQENRVHALKREVEHSVRMAQLIEYNLEDVDTAILAVRVALAKGLSWEDLARMVKEEKKSGNPVAGLIDKLHLDHNCIILLLSNNLDEMDDDEKTQPVDKVEVDLSLSAHANARRWYEMKKKQESKQEKTVSAHEKAFKAAERKTRFQLSQEKTVATISHIRKVLWFEKFNWFISSENYLVISGRDAQQNEMLVKRYMSKWDLYIHADLHGASSNIIKNHRPDQPVPPLTLNQAGCFTVCHSQAWDSKIVTSAWWVYPHQVSKTAPTGEYLTVGSFMIRGKKNFLPPHPLIMGFGLLFRLDESSLGSHLNERRVRGEEGLPVKDENGVDDADLVSDSEEEPTHENLPEPSKDPEASAENRETWSEGPGHSLTESNLHLSTSEVTHADEIPVQQKDCLSIYTSQTTTGGNNISSFAPQLEDLMDRALGLGVAAPSPKKYSKETTRLEESNLEEKKGSVRDKPYISKADRRKLKKGQKNSDGGAAVSKENEREEDESSLGEPDNKNAKPMVGKVSRGQKAKLKKIKEKYADQDEEERHIRMALLASSGKVNKDDSNLPDQHADNGNARNYTFGPEDAPKICYKCKKAGHLSSDCPEQPDIATHVNSRSANSTGVADLAEEDQVALEEDDIHEIAAEEKGKLNEVDYLTGHPLLDDILLYAVPVCGPYSALQTYKYRVKIIPGTAKKGKAAKTAMNLFSHMPDATNREKELMKACTDPELVAAIIGNVKITAAGLNQLKQKQKKGKKAASKAES